MQIYDANELNEVLVRPKLASLGTLAILVLLYCVSLVIYRLYLSPVSKFPGPKLAAITFWYQFYYDVTLRGQYTFEIEKMHKKYGPVIRINPEEIHIDVPDFYETLYGNTMTRRDKWYFTMRAFNIPEAIFGTLPHNLHRTRRAIINPFFSKRSVNKLEPEVKEMVEKLCSRFREFQRNKAPLNLHHAFAALTLDVISGYAFGQSYDAISTPDFAPGFLESIDVLAESTHFGAHFGMIIPIMAKLPEWLTLKLTPLMANLLTLQADIRKRVRGILNSYEKDAQSTSEATIFHAFLNADQPREEKQLPNLVAIGMSFVAAGQLTTADTMAMIIFYLLENPEMMEKIKAELEDAMPNPQVLPSGQKLEQLPYLSAVIQESLRLTMPIPHRLQRIAPDEDLEVAGWKIPRGTVMGMSAYLMHKNEELFPNPEEFRPERWLDPAEFVRLDKYMVAFGKGTRMCIGMNLAYSEIYLGLAAVLRRFDMKLYNTTKESVEFGADFFTPQTKNGPRRVQVMLE